MFKTKNVWVFISKIFIIFMSENIIKFIYIILSNNLFIYINILIIKFILFINISVNLPSNVCKNIKYSFS